MTTLPRPLARPRELSPVERLTRALATVIAALGVLHALTYACWFGAVCLPGPTLYNAAGRLLDLTAEQSIPNWLSIVLLAAVALACAVASVFEPRDEAGGWRGLAVLFAYLSLDEATDLHGYWILVLGDNLVPGIAHGFNWVIPGAVLVLAVALAFRPWLARQPAALRRRMIRAGAIYVGGGLLLKVAGALTAGDSFDGAFYLTVSSLEELLEMAGALLMLHAVLDLLARHLLTDAPEG